MQVEADIKFDIDTAILLGLIMNELVFEGIFICLRKKR
jgi:two-component sensor histidine kinase